MRTAKANNSQIGGTSTGGLIAIMLGRLEMDIETCIEAYKRLASTIFSNRKSIPMTWTGKVRAKFDAKPLEEAVKEIIKQAGHDPEEKLAKPENVCKT